MRTFFFFLFIGVFALAGFSVETDSSFNKENVFNLQSEASFSADSDLKDFYKTKVLKEVFNRLKMAKGDFRSRLDQFH